MTIDLRELTVRDLVEGYADDGEGGVRGYAGRLDIRPPFQREFIYKDKQRAAVIDTIQSGFPLNTMYWTVRRDGTYEVLDGQQRTISVAQYVAGDFSHNALFFHNLTADQQAQILDYRLMVYVCEGAASEKLKWFETINIAGEKLTRQELRNAVYAGPWTYDAKRYFSRTGAPAYQVGKDYVRGSPIRQDYLETALKWISDGEIEEYMARNQHSPTAVGLWNHYQSVIAWVKATFTEYRSQMKGVEWGTLYRDHKDDRLDPKELEKEVAALILDDDVTKKAGIYPYLLTRNEKYLNIRAFSAAQKQKAYEKQGKKCAVCGGGFKFKEMEGDHIKPWVEGGKTEDVNCHMLCKDCNRAKSAK